MFARLFFTNGRYFNKSKVSTYPAHKSQTLQHQNKIGHIQHLSLRSNE